jgi:hypothetical protein
MLDLRTPTFEHHVSERTSTRKFLLKRFLFELLESQLQKDIHIYRVSTSEFNIILIILGIDTTSECGPRSNVDFVHFMWRSFERFAFKKYPIALVPSPTTTVTPR